MAISHTTGLYIPFKINRQLTIEEREHMYSQGQFRDHGGESVALSFDTVIRMNSTYLEVVDKYYSTKGTICSMMMCMLSFLLLLISSTLWGMLFSPEHKDDLALGVFLCVLLALPAYFFSGVF